MFLWDVVFYMAKTATRAATKRDPKVKDSWDESLEWNSVGLAVEEAFVPVGLRVANVVAAGGAAVVMIPAGTVAGAGVPTTRAADEVPSAVWVWKTTWGTVIV